MGFGLFKKLKDKFKKVRGWIQSALPKVRKVMDKAAPVVKDILGQNPKAEKALKYLDVAKDGISAADEAINNRNYSGIKDWTKTNIVPKLKSNF